MISTLACFGPEALGDPLGAYPSLRRESRPYNLWLTEHILEAVLVRWQAGLAGPPPAWEPDLEWACAAARAAFRELLPAALRAGDGAVLAALGVTANLQRTLGLIAGAARRATDGEGCRQTRFALSRLWCGVVDLPAEAGAWPGGWLPPVRTCRPDPRRRDAVHVASALGCPPSAVAARCAAGLAQLEAEVRQSGFFGPNGAILG